MNEEDKGIFQVLSTLNLSGDIKKAGEFIEAHVEAFADLVELGVLKLVHGASTPDEATKILGEEAEVKAQEEQIQKEMPPENTWEATRPEAKAAMENANKEADASAGTVEKTETDTTASGTGSNETVTNKPTVEKYTIVSDEVTFSDGTSVPKEGIVELDPANQETIDLLAAGSIVATPVTTPETGEEL